MRTPSPPSHPRTRSRKSAITTKRDHNKARSQQKAIATKSSITPQRKNPKKAGRARPGSPHSKKLRPTTPKHQRKPNCFSRRSTALDHCGKKHRRSSDLRQKDRRRTNGHLRPSSSLLICAETQGGPRQRLTPCKNPGAARPGSPHSKKLRHPTPKYQHKPNYLPPRGTALHRFGKVPPQLRPLLFPRSAVASKPRAV
jgi:hypothetical protein